MAHTHRTHLTPIPAFQLSSLWLRLGLSQQSPVVHRKVLYTARDLVTSSTWKYNLDAWVVRHAQLKKSKMLIAVCSANCVCWEHIPVYIYRPGDQMTHFRFLTGFSCWSKLSLQTWTDPLEYYSRKETEMFWLSWLSPRDRALDPMWDLSLQVARDSLCFVQAWQNVLWQIWHIAL